MTYQKAHVSEGHELTWQQFGQNKTYIAKWVGLGVVALQRIDISGTLYSKERKGESCYAPEL